MQKMEVKYDCGQTQHTFEKSCLGTRHFKCRRWIADVLWNHIRFYHRSQSIIELVFSWCYFGNQSFAFAMPFWVSLHAIRCHPIPSLAVLLHFCKYTLLVDFASSYFLAHLACHIKLRLIGKHKKPEPPHRSSGVFRLSLFSCYVLSN